MVRQAVIAALPAAAKLKDPCCLLQPVWVDELSERSQTFTSLRQCPKVARRRLVFDEFFYLQLGLLPTQHAVTSAVLASHRSD